MKRLLFIYNPHAGKGLLKPKISDIVDIFVKAGYEVTIYPTQAYQDAYKKVLEYHSEDYELIVCSGGDGTLDEVVTGMMKREEREPIGYIPTGTTNDFANSLLFRRIFCKLQIMQSTGQNSPVMWEGLMMMCLCTLRHLDFSQMSLIRQNRK